MNTISLRFFAAACLAVASLEAAPIILNGSFTGPVTNDNVAPGWTKLTGSPDVVDQFNNVGVPVIPGKDDFVVAPSGPSPDGGTWISFARDTNYIETFGQMISGFTPGTQYAFTWFAANFGYVGTTWAPTWNNPNGVEIVLDGVSVGMGPIMPVGSDWTAQSAVVTATAQSHYLVLRNSTAIRSYISIDGLAINAIPEPATWVLLVSGLSAAVILGRRRVASRPE